MVSPKGESVWLIIYEVKTILIMFSDLSPENPKTRNTGFGISDIFN